MNRHVQKAYAALIEAAEFAQMIANREMATHSELFDRAVKLRLGFEAAAEALKSVPDTTPEEPGLWFESGEVQRRFAGLRDTGMIAAGFVMASPESSGLGQELARNVCDFAKFAKGEGAE